MVAITAMALGGGQAARAATVSCGAIDASSIISGTPPNGSCGNIQSGDDFEINFNGVLSTANKYSLQVANLSTGAANVQAFSNVQLLVTGAIGGTGFADQPITIWPNSANSGANNQPNSPATSQGLVNGSYTTSAVAGTGYTGSATFNGYSVKNTAAFSLTSPNNPTQLGTAGLVITEPLLLSSVGITSFTGFKIRGTFTGSGPFAAGLGIFSSNDPATQPPNLILGNAFNIPAPGPLPVLGAGAAFGWSRRLRRRLGTSKPAA